MHNILIICEECISKSSSIFHSWYQWRWLINLTSVLGNFPYCTLIQFVQFVLMSSHFVIPLFSENSTFVYFDLIIKTLPLRPLTAQWKYLFSKQWLVNSSQRNGCFVIFVLKFKNNDGRKPIKFIVSSIMNPKIFRLRG